MIPIFYVEDLTVEDVDALIERGVCFDITSKNTLLSKRPSYINGDDIRSSRDKLSRYLQQGNSKQSNC